MSELHHLFRHAIYHALRHAGAGHARPARGADGYEDPTIEEAALGLACEVWNEMNARRMAGEVWYVARERALAPRLKQWAGIYGAGCAARARQIVMALDPNSAPPEVLKSERDSILERLITLKKTRGRKITLLDRLSIGLAGMLWSQ